MSPIDGIDDLQKKGIINKLSGLEYKTVKINIKIFNQV